MGARLRGAVTTGAVVPLSRNRDFQLLWSGAALSQIGSMVSATAYPILVLALTGSPAWAGAVATVGQLPNLLVQMPAGVAVDRWNRKRVMIACDAVRCFALACAALLVFSGRLSAAMLLPLAFVEGTGTVLYRLAEVGAIRNVVPGTQLSQAIAANQVRTYGAAFVGRPLGGVLFGLGRYWPFVGDALTYAVSLVTVVLTRGRFSAPPDPDGEVAPTQSGGVWRESAAGLAWLWRQPYLRAITAMVPFATLVLQVLPLVVVVIATELRVSPANIGVLLLGFSIGGLLGSLTAGWLRRALSLRSVVLASPWCWAASCALAALVTWPWVLIVAMAGVGATNAAWSVAVDSYQMSMIPDDLLGRVNASIRLIAYGTGTLGPALTGLLLAWVGGRGGMWAMAAGLAALALVTIASPVLRRGPVITSGHANATIHPQATGQGRS